jgi:hypothetical protein
VASPAEISGVSRRAMMARKFPTLHNRIENAAVDTYREGFNIATFGVADE